MPFNEPDPLLYQEKVEMTKEQKAMESAKLLCKIYHPKNQGILTSDNDLKLAIQLATEATSVEVSNAATRAAEAIVGFHLASRCYSDPIALIIDEQTRVVEIRSLLANLHQASSLRCGDWYAGGNLFQRIEKLLDQTK